MNTYTHGKASQRILNVMLYFDWAGNEKHRDRKTRVLKTFEFMKLGLDLREILLVSVKLDY